MKKSRKMSFDEVIQRDRYIFAHDVRLELDHQLTKFGVQRHSPEKWMLILLEEVGEAAQALLQHGGCVQRERYEQEMIQVAAVAIAAMESLDAMDPKGILARRMKATKEEEKPVEVVVKCSECKSDLNIEDIDDPEKHEYRAIVRVKPCADCIDAAREKAREEGREEGREAAEAEVRAKEEAHDVTD